MISPYLFDRKWYNEKKKKPHLQLQILKEILNSGSLSKSKARSQLKKNYKDISTCFDNLDDKGLIELSAVRPGRGIPEKITKSLKMG